MTIKMTKEATVVAARVLGDNAKLIGRNATEEHVMRRSILLGVAYDAAGAQVVEVDGEQVDAAFVGEVAAHLIVSGSANAVRAGSQVNLGAYASDCFARAARLAASAEAVFAELEEDDSSETAEVVSAAVVASQDELKLAEDKALAEQKAKDAAQAAAEAEALARSAAKAKEKQVEEEAKANATPEDPDVSPEAKLRATKVTELMINGRAKNAFEKANIATVGQIIDYTETKGSLEQINGIGDEMEKDTLAAISLLREHLEGSNEKE